MNCNDAVAALVASMENGISMTDEQREHIRSCERCRELLDSAKQFQTLLAGNGVRPPEAAATLAAAEEEVSRQRYWHVLKVIAGFFLLFVLVTTIGVLRLGKADPRELWPIAGAVYGVLVLVISAVLALLWRVLRTTRRGPRPLYKRLGQGRLLSGVCLGLAEATDLDVRLLRILFLVLMMFEGAGFWLYLLLDLAVPVHPDDRQHLLRFRLRRWWQGRKTSNAIGG